MMGIGIPPQTKEESLLLGGHGGKGHTLCVCGARSFCQYNQVEVGDQTHAIATQQSRPMLQLDSLS